MIRASLHDLKNAHAWTVENIGQRLKRLKFNDPWKNIATMRQSLPVAKE
jgi:hypothetical protein